MPYTFSKEKQVRDQIRELELRGKMTFVPEGRLHDLLQRELMVEKQA